MLKTCPKNDCEAQQQPQSIDNFAKDKSKKDGRKTWCKKCCKKHIRKWSHDNKDKRKEYSKQYVQNNREKMRDTAKRYYHDNKEHCQSRALQYYHDNKEERMAYQKQRFQQEENLTKRRQWQSEWSKHQYRTNPHRKLRMSMSNAINRSLRYNQGNKNGNSWMELVNYTIDELKQHLENQFTEGMSWEKFLNGEIHIDHIRPVSSFDITSIDCKDFQECWSLENLQPLWAEDNLKKWAKISHEWNNE